MADWNGVFDYDDADTCPTCDGEEFIFERFDGQCLDSDVGCDLCTRPCPTCCKHLIAPVTTLPTPTGEA
jgi:hypothetical protein